MMGRMSAQEKEAMMGAMMEKFFASMSAGDKKAMMAEIMPKMMEGVNMMEMMPKMMMAMMGGGKHESGMPGMMTKMLGGDGHTPGATMPHMMSDMMPHCLGAMLPNMPKESRTDFILKLIDVEMKTGSAGLTEDEKKNFVARVLEKVKA
jgi:hypothetical protein